MAKNGIKSGGRKKGTPNKIGFSLREEILGYLEGNFQTVVTSVKKLPARDQAKFYLDLLQYGLSKLQATPFEIDFDSLTDDQLDKLINRLLEKSKTLKVA
jgi:hypothetical protein